MYRPPVSYGVDLSADHLVVVRSARTRKGVEPATLLDQDGDALPDALRAELDAAVSGGRAVVAGCLAAHETVTRWLQTPLASVSKARKVLPSLLDIQLPFPLESCVYDFVEFRRSPERRVDALAVAARVQDAAARIETFRKAGLDPARLDHEGLALWTLSIRERPMERNASRVVAFLGHDRIALVLGAGESFRSAHSLRIGVRDLFPGGDAGTPDRLRPFALRVQQVLGASLAELDAATLQWVWTGPGAARPGVLTALQSALSGLSVARFLSHEDPASFLARALAARALEPGPLDCNFRTGALAHPMEARQREGRARRAAAALLAAGLVLCAANGAWRTFLAHRERAAQAAVTALAQELSQLSRIPRGQEALVARRALDERAPLVQPFLQAFEPSLTSLLADLLAAAKENRIVIESLSLGNDSASLRGAAEDWNVCERLADRLRSRGFAAQTDREDAGADERVHFAVKANRPAARRATP